VPVILLAEPHILSTINSENEYCMVSLPVILIRNKEFSLNRATITNVSILLALISISSLISTPAFAAEKAVNKDELTDKVIQAYGGEKLSQITSLSVSDRYKIFSIDQGANPEVNDVSRLNSILNVDFESGKKSVKSWRKSSNGNRLSEILFDGETGWSINHLRGTHVENNALTTDVVGAGMMRMVDTILALRLQKHRNTAKLISHGLIAGKSIYTLSFKAGNKRSYYLDIDAASGLILRMSQSENFINGSVYEFGNHKVVQGLTFATDMNMLVKGKPSFITLSRSIEVNKVNQQVFSIPKGSIKLKGMIDSSTMTVQKLADDVYLAGKNTNFSIFVDAGDYLVGGGGLSGLNKRLDAVNQFLGTNKSIEVQVIPDHHRGHLGAIKELEDLGSSIVIAAEHRNIIESLISNESQQNEFISINKKMTLAKGLVEVYDISTVHSKNYLLFYVPSAKLVFSADHFGTNLIDALPSANNTTKTFYDEIERLGIPVDKYASSHGPRILSAADMQTVLSGYQVKSCIPGHNICID